MKKKFLKFGSTIMSIIMMLSIVGVAFTSIPSVTTEAQGYAGQDGYIPTLSGWYNTSRRVDLIVPNDKAVEWWSTLGTISELPYGGGIHFDLFMGCMSAIGVRQGMDTKSDLDGLDLHFDNLCHFTGWEGHGRFAIVLAKGAGYTDAGPASAANASQGAVIVIVDPMDGQLELAQLNSAGTYDTDGRVLINNDILKYDNIANKPFSFEFFEGTDGNYSIAVTVDGTTVTADDVITASEVSVLNDENGNKRVVTAISTWNDGCFTLDFTAVNCEPNNWAVPNSGNYSIPDALSYWPTMLHVNEIANDGGIAMGWYAGAVPGVRQGINYAAALDGMTLYFSNLTSTSEGGNFVICLSDNKQSNPGDPNDYVNSLFLVIDTSAGKLKRATSADSVIDLLETDLLKYSNITGKDFSIKFNLTTRGALNITVTVGGESETVTGAVTKTEFAGITNFTNYSHVYPELSAWYESAGLSLEFDSVNRKITDNSSLIPSFDSYEDQTDTVATPSWVEDLIMVEFNPYEVSEAGTLDAAVELRDHYAQLGVNGLWITPVYDVDLNTNSLHNGYINKGINTIDPVLTGTDDYEAGFQKLADFVTEAHKRNIRVILDVISWGTDKTSTLVTSHSDWYQKKDGSFVTHLDNGYYFDWDNALTTGLFGWYVEELVNLIDTTDADGLRYDMEPGCAGYDVFAAVKENVLETCGKQIFTVCENSFDSEEGAGAFDASQSGVDMTAWGSTADGLTENLTPYYANPSDPFLTKTDHYNIVDNIKTGQNIKNSGALKYYINSLSNHDYAKNIVSGSRIGIGYAGIFSPFIPQWMAGDEFGNSTDDNLIYKGNVLYFNNVKFYERYYPDNTDYLEDVKAMIALRRTYSDLFVSSSDILMETNICKVDSTANIQAYARYAQDPAHTDTNRAMLVIPNYSNDAETVTVTTPFEAAGIKTSENTLYKVTDAETGAVIATGTMADMATFDVAVDAMDQRVLLVEQDGDFIEDAPVIPEEPVNTLIVPNTSMDYIMPLSMFAAGGGWNPYMEVTDVEDGGIKFTWKTPPYVNCIRTGLMQTFALDGLTLNLANYVPAAFNTQFAIVLSDVAADPAYDISNATYANQRMIIHIRPQDGALFIRNADGSDTGIFSSTTFASNCTTKPFTISFKKGTNGGYDVSVTIDGVTETRENGITAELLAASGIECLDCVFVAFSNLDTNNYNVGPTSIELKSIGNVRTPTNNAGLTVPSESNMAIGSHWQGGMLTRTELETGGMRLDFSGSVMDVRAVINESVNMNGATLAFDNYYNYEFSTNAYNDKLTIMFGNTDSQSNDFGSYSGMFAFYIDGYTGDLVQINGGAAALGEKTLVKDESLKKLIGRPFTVTIRKSEADGSYKLLVKADGVSVIATIDTSMITAFDMEKPAYVSITCPYLYPIGNFTVDWVGQGNVTYTSGDANDDGAVNILDLVHLKKAEANITSCNNVDNADFNIDGTVNATDLTLVRQYLLSK